MFLKLLLLVDVLENSLQYFFVDSRCSCIGDIVGELHVKKMAMIVIVLYIYGSMGTASMGHFCRAEIFLAAVRITRYGETFLL